MPHREVGTRGCMCSGINKWSARGQHKRCVCLEGFLCGGTKEWLMRFRECPDAEGFPTSIICEFTSSP